MITRTSGPHLHFSAVTRVVAARRELASGPKTNLRLSVFSSTKEEQLSQKRAVAKNFQPVLALLARILDDRDS